MAYLSGETRTFFISPAAMIRSSVLREIVSILAAASSLISSLIVVLLLPIRPADFCSCSDNGATSSGFVIVKIRHCFVNIASASRRHDFD
jgi:hypothetical protein